MINSTPRFKRASMFECYRVLISHVSGCLQFVATMNLLLVAGKISRATKWQVPLSPPRRRAAPPRRHQCAHMAAACPHPTTAIVRPVSRRVSCLRSCVAALNRRSPLPSCRRCSARTTSTLTTRAGSRAPGRQRRRRPSAMSATAAEAGRVAGRHAEDAGQPTARTTCAPQSESDITPPLGPG